MTAPTIAPPREVLPWNPAEPAITQTGLYVIPDDVYHADPVPGGSLSASGAKKLLPPSCPALFDFERRNKPTPTKAFSFGHAAHQKVLGVGPDIVVVDADSWRTNAAKAQRDAALARGAVPLLPDDYAVVEAMAEALKKHPIAMSLFRDGDGLAETSLFWTDEATGVTRRSRLDWLPNDTGRRLIISDYKTAISADPQKFAKAATDYGYYMQAAWYRDAVVALNLSDDPAFVFTIQEKTPPYLVSVIELDANALRIGGIRNRQAITTYAECTASGKWPGYSEDVELVSLPFWFEREYETL